MVIILRLFPKILGLSVCWEHLNDINHVLQHVRRWEECSRLENGHLCTSGCGCGSSLHYEGRYPEDRKVQKIIDWPDCNTLTEVRGFLGVCGIVRIWVKDFARCVKPLILLTKKDTEFVWGTDQKASMEDLKQAIVMAPCLQPI